MTAQPEGHARRDDVDAERIADDRSECDAPAVRECATDDEQHARPGDDDEDERGECELGQAGGGDHAVNLAAGRASG